MVTVLNLFGVEILTKKVALTLKIKKISPKSCFFIDTRILMLSYGRFCLGFRKSAGNSWHCTFLLYAKLRILRAHKGDTKISLKNN